MSKNQYIVVELPHKELKKKLDILEKAGIKIYSDSISKSDKAICFHAISKEVFSTDSETEEGDKFVNSWREFVLEILKYYFCEVGTSYQADFLYNSVGAKCHGYGTRFRHDDIIERFGFFSDTDNKEQLTFEGFKLLLNSTKENNMQDKNQQTINLELTPQEVAFLVAYTTASSESTKRHLHEIGVYFMDEFVKAGKKSELWQKLKQPLCNAMGGGLYDLNKLKPLFPPEIPLFEFKNGLITKINNDTVSIGRKTKKPQDWTKYCDQIIELGLDKVEIDGYSFSKVEIDRFRDWLKNNF